MASSLEIAIRNLKRAEADLARHESRKAPNWYVDMYRVEVECCAAEVAVWQNMPCESLQDMR